VPAQMLSPFTFHDIQRRVGVVSKPTTFQNDNSTLNPQKSLPDHPLSQKIQRNIDEGPKVATIEKDDSSTLNPFEPLLDDPSSFVSSLTSLHLHLSEEKSEKNVPPTSMPNFFQTLSQSNFQSDQIQSVSNESRNGFVFFFF
jgi:hypothetical protein